jgi:hypothetical protein
LRESLVIPPGDAGLRAICRSVRLNHGNYDIREIVFAHELSLTNSMLNTALKYANKTNSERVVTIVLTLGALRDIQKQWIEHYFGYKRLLE